MTTNTEENEHWLMLSYKGKGGETRLKSLQNTLKSVIPQITRVKLSTLGQSYLQNLTST